MSRRGLGRTNGGRSPFRPSTRRRTGSEREDGEDGEREQGSEDEGGGDGVEGRRGLWVDSGSHDEDDCDGLRSNWRGSTTGNESRSRAETECTTMANTDTDDIDDLADKTPRQR